MYDAARAATVRAKEEMTCWALDRMTFKRILMDTTTKKRQMYRGFLQDVPLLVRKPLVSINDNKERNIVRAFSHRVHSKLKLNNQDTREAKY